MHEMRRSKPSEEGPTRRTTASKRTLAKRSAVRLTVAMGTVRSTLTLRR
jgi:hypothetical protein